jgi:pyrophosphatase PpaX
MYGRIVLGDFMKKINTILFDLDGTLINTNEIIIESFFSTFETHFPELVLTREKVMTFIGPTLNETFGNYTNDPFTIQSMIESYREYYVEFEFDSFEIYPGVTETLKKLKLQGYNLGIVTSKFKSAAWPSYTHYNLQDFFSVFVSLDDVKHPKPNREPIDVAISRFENVKGCIMIGDNVGDILAGKNADIYSAGVAWSLKGSAHLMSASPDFMLSDMSDIFRILKIIEEE